MSVKQENESVASTTREQDVFPTSPNTSSDTSSQGSQDHNTPRVVRNPFKTIYRWFRANTFRPAWLPKWLRHPVSGYLAAVLLQVVAVMATLLLAQIFPTFAYPAALEFLAIILVAVTWGAGPSLAATLVGLALLNYVVVPPHFRWSFASPQDVVEAILFLAVGLAISIVATRIEHARRSAEELATSLAAERTRLDAVIETVPDMVSIHDATGRIVRVNRAAREKAGERGGERLENTQETYGLRTVTGEPFPAEALPVARALQGEIVSNVEMRGRDDAGNDLYMLVSAAPMRDLQGKVDGIVAITHDISALRQTEFAAAIRASELEATFETMADVVFVFGSDGQVVRMNAAARELFALDAGIDLSQPLHERGYKTVVLDEHDQPIPEDEWPLFRVVRGEVLTSANALDMRVRTATGREVELSVSGAPLLDHEGHIVGAVCICRDVTERRILERRTNDALEALLRMAEALVLVPDPATSTTGELSLTGSSRVAQRLVELTRSVLGCKRVAITSVEPETNELHAIAAVGLSPEQEHEWRAMQPGNPTWGAGNILSNMFANAASTTPLSNNEVRIIDMAQPLFRDQPNPYDIRVMLLAPMNVGNQLVGILSVDYGDDEHEYTPDEIALAGAVAKLGALVLERERLLRERAEARANEIALRAANQQMEEFLGMISHELKTPLTSIKGNTQLAMRQLKNSIQTFEKILHLQESAEQQSKRLNRMVDDLLDVSRTQAGHLELRLAPCDLVEIVQQSVAEQRTAWPGRTITFDVAEEMKVPIQADADRVGQVITNYLTNALKYSDDDHPVQVSLRVEGEEVRVAVRDKGPGLSAEDQQLIWERFQRVPGIEVRGTPHSATAGLGLGLYISKTIIEGHNGRVGVESVLGEGSTFWFTLPLARQEG